MSKGLAGVKTLTAKQIADKWKLPLATVAKKIAAGVKVEKEHTTSTRQANEIARDHLGERPDYYDKLHKMEKTKVVKEESATSAVRGLGYVSGDPGVDYVDQYINTNVMSYDDWNGNILMMIRDKHNKYLKDMGFTSFTPNELQNNSNKAIKEAKLNELGEYGNKGGMSGYEGVSGPIRSIRKNGMKERSLSERGKVPADMAGAAIRGIYQEEDNTKPDVNLMGNQKPDAYGYGAKGTTHTVKEETKMDNKELINEALDCILEDNLPEMKDNLMKALQEKALEKLEERKKEIAAQYFAQ